MNNHIINALKERLAKINEEKAAIESHIAELEKPVRPKEWGRINTGKVLSTDGNGIAIWNKTFPQWLKEHGIRLKKGDRRYSKFYQRFRYEKKKVK